MDSIELKHINKVAPREAFCKINFPVRYHAEFLLYSGKLSPKFFTEEKCNILAQSSDSKYKQQVCISFLNACTQQRPDWEQLKKDLLVEAPEPPIDMEYLPVPRISIDTDGSLVMYPIRLDETNRVLRQFAEYSLHFLRIEFKVKNTRVKEEKASQLEKNKRKVITEGVTIAGRHYEFLMCTDAGMRYSKCWMFSPVDGITPTVIRSWMGDFSNIHSAYKYGARMGMCFSVSTPTIHITKDQVETVPDLISSNGRYCFSDGCGQISGDAAERISKIMNLPYVPSVFQIRYQGVKGVVAINPELPENIHLRIRPSMIKFRAPLHDTIEVLNVSSPQRGCLERQLVLILHHLGVSPDNLMSVQNEAIQELLESMKHPLDKRFVFEKNPLLYETVHNAVEKGLINVDEIMLDPFLSRMIGNAAYSNLRLIEKKSVIPIKQARNAIGVVDETGKLQPGQVFFQYSTSLDLRKSSTNTTIVSGKVALGKCPALHPGDIRVVECVDIPDLHHLVDCIVFPQTGDRPVTDQIAMGSDLDGDMYYIVWDTRLVPDHDVPAGDYGSFSAEELKEGVEFNQEEMVAKMKEAFITFLNVDNTGAIFNAHMSFADAQGLDCEPCQTLISAFKSAVGAAKHGTVYNDPFPIPDSYPHYQLVKPTRHSDHILGQLCDHSEKSNDTLFSPLNAPLAQIRIENYDAEIEAKAQPIFKQYCREVYDLVASVDYHGFLDLYNPQSYMIKIIEEYAKRFKQQAEELSLSTVELFNYWNCVATKEALQVKLKPKGTTNRDLFDESICLLLSFPWAAVHVK